VTLLGRSGRTTGSAQKAAPAEHNTIAARVKGSLLVPNDARVENVLWSRGCGAVWDMAVWDMIVPPCQVASDGVHNINQLETI
jgi:hypothetical protein